MSSEEKSIRYGKKYYEARNKKRRKENPQVSNITEVQRAKKTQEDNKKAFDKSYWKLKYKI